MDARRDEFRKYLEETGLIAALTKALMKLYELKYDRPECAITFIQQNLSEGFPTLTEYENVLQELTELRSQLASALNPSQIVGTALNASTASIKSSSNAKSASQIRSAAGSSTAQGSSITQKNCGSSESIKNATNLVTALHDNPECNSLLKKHLTLHLYNKLKDRKTSLGTRLVDCINSGLINHQSSIGIYAADVEAYDIFDELFSSIIEDYHVGFTSDMTHPEPDWGDASSFANLDPDNEFIISTRIRCARTVADFPLNPLMTEEHYLNLLGDVREVLLGLNDDLSGTLYVLEEMDSETKQKLIEDHLLFKDDDKYLEAAGATRFWAKGRAIFMNEPRTFSVWINEEDHLRFISMEKGGDLGNVYSRLKNAVEKCSERLLFSSHPRFGWLTFCPTNLGTTIRASVMIKVPKLAAHGNALQELVDKLQLEIRGTHGEHSEVVDGIYEISNKRRLGLTEFEAVKVMYDGIAEIIQTEKSTE